MIQINLPKELLPKETLKSLPAKEKEEYLSNLLKKLLELNPAGITTSQIREATGLTYSTLWHHLEMLNSTAQCYKISRGNLDIYCPTGIISHLNEYEKGDVKYSIGTIKNSEGSFVCIHEKRKNRAGNLAVSSGIVIPTELIDEIIKILHSVKE